ncbi:MAG: 2-hydroxyacid dehydrogenase [Deferrisomatales bacterium]
MKILFCDTAFPSAREALARDLPTDEILWCPQAEVPGRLAEAEVAIPLMTRLTAELLERAPRLRLVHQFGAGLEGVDREAARRLGIPVANVPSGETGNAASVAEWTVFLMMALARDLRGVEASVRAGRLGAPVGAALAGKRAGLVGLGSLGAAIAGRLRAFGMEVWGVRRSPDPGDAARLGLAWAGGPADLPRLLEASDFVVLAAPLTAETRGLIGRAELGRMKPSAFLVNVGRGPVADYGALLEALREKRIAGAGLDVFWTEPIDPADPLLAENVVASPHIAGVTDHSYRTIARALADNVERLRRGEPLENAAW